MTAAPDWEGIDVDVDGAIVRAHRTGDPARPPLVLAHGFSDDGGCWSRFASAVADRFDVVAVDARNHGSSARGAADHATSAGDLATVIERLALRSPTVIGHSLGASTAALLATTRPRLVGRLVLEDPPWTAVDHPPDTARLDALRDWVRSLTGRSDDELVELGRRQHPTWSDADLVPWAAAKRRLDPRAVDQLRPLDWRATVPRLRCPTLLITGDRDDALVDDAVADELRRSGRVVDVVRLAGAGHNVRREAFGAYVDAVVGFAGAGRS